VWGFITLGLSLLGIGASLYGSHEARRSQGEAMEQQERARQEAERAQAEIARRQAEERRKLEEERQKFIAEQKRIAEENARIKKEKLLKDIGLKRQSYEINEADLRQKQEEQKKEIQYKINVLSRSYGEAFSSLTALQTVKGVTQTLVPKQERMTRAYREEEGMLGLQRQYKTHAFENALGALGIARKELSLLEQYGKETNELKLLDITQKTEQQLLESRYRITGDAGNLSDFEKLTQIKRKNRIESARRELDDFRTASKIGDFQTLLRGGKMLVEPYIEKSLYSNVFKKEYTGSNYDELMDSLTGTGNIFKQKVRKWA
jgi:hypothetical protein